MANNLSLTGAGSGSSTLPVGGTVYVPAGSSYTFPFSGNISIEVFGKGGDGEAADPGVSAGGGGGGGEYAAATTAVTVGQSLSVTNTGAVTVAAVGGTGKQVTCGQGEGGAGGSGGAGGTGGTSSGVTAGTRFDGGAGGDANGRADGGGGGSSGGNAGAGNSGNAPDGGAAVGNGGAGGDGAQHSEPSVPATNPGRGGGGGGGATDNPVTTDEPPTSGDLGGALITRLS